MSSSHTISNYKVQTLPYNDLNMLEATYMLTLPPEHFANGTDKAIVQRCKCIISFSDFPCLSMRGKLIKIDAPERFGPYSTHEERIQYVYNFVHDTAVNS